MINATVLITGANRGLGLEFVRHYLQNGWRVIATCRDPDAALELQQLLNRHAQHLEIQALDVADPTAIKNLAKHFAGQSIDILLNNAGLYGPSGLSFGDVEPDTWIKVWRVNTMAPLLMAQAFIEHVAASQQHLIVNISSQMGSISDNQYGRAYIYRSSKAALNAVMKSASIDLAERGIKVLLLHPGWVQTEMGGSDATLPADESVQRLCKMIANASMQDSGKLISHDGSVIDW